MSEGIWIGGHATSDEEREQITQEYQARQSGGGYQEPDQGGGYYDGQMGGEGTGAGNQTPQAGSDSLFQERAETAAPVIKTLTNR